MSKSQQDKDEQVVLETKKAANVANHSNPVLTPTEQARLTVLQGE